MRILTAVFLLMLTACGQVSQYEGRMANRKAVKDLKENRADLARDALSRGLEDLPLESVLHHNLGLSFDVLKLAEDADKSYQVADTLAPTPEQKFYARFNRGELYGRGKKIDEALAQYQRALEIDPNSKETKTNIELLLSGQGGQGEGEDQQQDSKDKKDGKGQQNKKDGKGQGDQKDPKDDKDGEGQKDKEDPSKDGQKKQSAKYVPRQYKGDLKESEVRKILGEIKQQEQKIRSEFNRKDVKEQPRDKDW